MLSKIFVTLVNYLKLTEFCTSHKNILGYKHTHKKSSLYYKHRQVFTSSNNYISHTHKKKIKKNPNDRQYLKFDGYPSNKVSLTHIVMTNNIRWIKGQTEMITWLLTLRDK